MMTEDLRFSFEGRDVTARPGQSIAGALHAAGVRVLGWSPRYRRPRGFRCGTGTCPGCTLRVDGLPGVLACMTPVRGGERVERIRPWLHWLPADRIGWLVPAGFQGGRLFRSPLVWRLAAPLLARLAGQAPLPAVGAIPGRGTFAERSVDVLVVGAGETGLRAAADEAGSGRSVLVVDRDTDPGGSLLLEPGGAAVGERLAAEARAAGAEIRLCATAIGAFDDGVEGIVIDGGLLAVHAARTIHACGARDGEVSLPDGDRPGVMLASAVLRLIVREGVQPGRRAVVVEAGGETASLVALLEQAGVAVVARCVPESVTAIHGRSWVTGVTAGVRRIPSDLVVVAGPRRPADELARQAAVDRAPAEGGTP